MSRRFQFSLRAIMALIAVVAIGCAFWIRLGAAAHLAIMTGAAGLLVVSLATLGWMLPDVLINLIFPVPPPGQRPIVTRRRRRRNRRDEKGP